ncbi:MAG: hypothetical protein WC355_01870 [Candidatus Omnitrophota bacterium]|jgi:hypothetical protein
MFNARSLFLTILFAVYFYLPLLAQEVNLEVTVDLSANTTPLPRLFQPNIDLGGRGFHKDSSWPQNMAAKEALELWGKDIGFCGLYRIQYNFWEISQLAKSKEAQEKLLSNYEAVIKNISDSEGTVILNVFGTPAGLGKALDNKSTPLNLEAFKVLVKDTMKYLSCEKKYNIWYEVWSGPDSDDFFIGSQQDYLNMYRIFAESAKELGAQFKIKIPVGAPSLSGWFHNLEGNNILTPEKSLIYDLIKFASAHSLPLDFITWHAFSSDPKTEKEPTIYGKNTIELIRDWLSYFNFKRETPLIVDEWNFDRDVNLLPARRRGSFIAASYIPSRIKHMYEAGLDNQVYFSLEDFQNNPEHITRNVGAFYFDSEQSHYKGGPKTIYNVFKMLRRLGPDMFSVKLNDDFAGIIATKSPDEICIMVYNYIDPDIVKSYLAHNIFGLNNAERQSLLQVIRINQLGRFMAHEMEVPSLRAMPKVKAVLNRARELADKAKELENTPRLLKFTLKGIKSGYSYSRFVVDSSCGLGCEFKAVEEKDIPASDIYQEDLKLAPYSVSFIILKKKTDETKDAPKG